MPSPRPCNPAMSICRWCSKTSTASPTRTTGRRASCAGWRCGEPTGGELLKDEDEGGWIIPIFALAHEHDPDPAMRPYQEPMSAGRREGLIVRAAAGTPASCRYL